MKIFSSLVIIKYLLRIRCLYIIEPPNDNHPKKIVVSNSSSIPYKKYITIKKMNKKYQLRLCSSFFEFKGQDSFLSLTPIISTQKAVAMLATSLCYVISLIINLFDFDVTIIFTCNLLLIMVASNVRPMVFLRRPHIMTLSSYISA